MGPFMRSYMEFGPVVQKEMLFKDTSYLEIWQPFCSADRNHLCKFGRRHHEKQFYEIILNFGPVVQEEMHFKVFLYGALTALLFSRVLPFVQFW